MRLLIACLLFSSIAFAQAPSLFFSDITSGPSTGGETVSTYAGSYVTLYGNNLGASQGASAVTLNSASCLRVVSWGSAWNTYQKLVVQLGSSCSSGNFVVTTSSGASNGLAFTVRTGHIYFVSTSGNDSTGTGSAASPWRTIVNAKNSMIAGDITYVENGVSQLAVDDYGSDLAIVAGGTSTAVPIALLAYPGATASIGTAADSYAIRTPAIAGSKNYWVIGGLKLVALDGIDIVSVDGWRVVGNDFSCPSGFGQSACFHTDTTTNLKFFGNYVHNVGDANGSIDKFYHAVYFTTNSNSIEAAWNTIVPNPTGQTTQGACRAMQFFSTSGSDQYDLHVHDNLIHDAICDGINFATVNTNNGTVEAYNNVVYHVGTGPDPGNGSSNYSCVLAGSSETGTPPVLIYNNTFYDCGSRKTGDAGAISPQTAVQLKNNIIYQTTGETYINANQSGLCSSVTGSTNIFFGVGTPPCSMTGNSNPLIVSTSTPDFHLQAGSPAIDAGQTIASLGTDRDGIIRPQGTAYEVGA